MKIIFDTDIGGDCDDAGALALFHRLCDKGEAELLAVAYCYSNPYVAGCIDSINKYYGRKVSIGINYANVIENEDTSAEFLCISYSNDYPTEDYKNRIIPDTLAILKRALSLAEIV